MVAQKPELTTYTLFSSADYNASMLFYRLEAQAKYKHTVAWQGKQQLADLKTGDVVVLCGEEDISAIKERFTTSVLVAEPKSLCTTLLLEQMR